jgi:peroxiredoxin family protein
MVSEPQASEANVSLVPCRKGTVLLVSGDLDKALMAFEIAAGFQAMGMEMSLWFVLYGVNCIKKPRSFLSPAKWWGRKRKPSPGRNPETDVLLQHVVRALNCDGAQHLPLSQLNFGGIGSRIMRHIMRHKGMAQLEDLIVMARDLGVRFIVCQVCVDVLALTVPDDLVVDAELKGVSAYYLAVAEAHYNAVF